jgi:hypothetical protein
MLLVDWTGPRWGGSVAFWAAGIALLEFFKQKGQGLVQLESADGGVG